MYEIIETVASALVDRLLIFLIIVIHLRASYISLLLQMILVMVLDNLQNLLGECFSDTMK